MTNYVICGKNQFREREKLNRILDQVRVAKEDRIEIDASKGKTFKIEEVLIACGTMSLFQEDHRVVIVRDPWFIKAGEKGAPKVSEDARKHLVEALEGYLKDPNPGCTLIFYLDGSDVDTRRKEYKILEKYHVGKLACDLIKPWDFPDHITELLKNGGFVLDPEARREFDERVGTDEFQLHHAIEKLDLYGEKKYDADTIRRLIPEDMNLDMWKMGNAFLKGRISDVITSRNQMYANGMSAMDMIPLLSSQLRKAYDIRALRDLGYDNAAIAMRLRIKESAVRMNLKNLGGMRAGAILHRMTVLADVEQGIKTGKYEANPAFEAYLLKYGGHHV